MKHITLAIITAFIFSLFSFESNAQISDGGQVFAEGQPVYWFYVSVSIKTDPRTRIESYALRLLGRRVQAGSVEDFEVQLWRHLSRGSRLAIGPYANIDEAEEAMTFYDALNRDTLVYSDFIDKGREIHYYMLDVYIRERSKSYGIQRIPAAVGTAGYDTFWQLLNIGLSQKKIAVGPFWRNAVAEESKRLYRLQ